jgi:hypothetical protein
MGVHIDVDVEGLDEMGDAIREGVAEGLRDSGDWLLENGEERAEDIVAGRRVFNREVREGFYSYGDNLNQGSRWRGIIKNRAKHAGVVDEGLAPAGEGRNANPAVQDLLPWVVRNMQPVSISPDSKIGEKWQSDLKELAAEFGPGYVMTAFKLKNTIESDGIPGIHYSDKTAAYLDQVGPMVTKNKVKKNLRYELRKLD